MAFALSVPPNILAFIHTTINRPLKRQPLSGREPVAHGHTQHGHKEMPEAGGAKNGLAADKNTENASRNKHPAQLFHSAKGHKDQQKDATKQQKNRHIGGNSAPPVGANVGGKKDVFAQEINTRQHQGKTDELNQKSHDELDNYLI